MRNVDFPQLDAIAAHETGDLVAGFSHDRVCQSSYKDSRRCSRLGPSGKGPGVGWWRQTAIGLSVHSPPTRLSYLSGAVGWAPRTAAFLARSHFSQRAWPDGVDSFVHDRASLDPCLVGGTQIRKPVLAGFWVGKRLRDVLIRYAGLWADY